MNTNLVGDNMCDAHFRNIIIIPILGKAIFNQVYSETHSWQSILGKPSSTKFIVKLTVGNLDCWQEVYAWAIALLVLSYLRHFLLLHSATKSDQIWIGMKWGFSGRWYKITKDVIILSSNDTWKIFKIVELDLSIFFFRESWT